MAALSPILIYVVLGLGALGTGAAVAVLVFKGLRAGAQAEPVLAQAEKDRDAALSNLEIARLPDASPSVFARLRDVDGKGNG